MKAAYFCSLSTCSLCNCRKLQQWLNCIILHIASWRKYYYKHCEYYCLVGPDPSCWVLCLLFPKSFVKNKSESSAVNPACESGGASAIKNSESTLQVLSLLWCVWPPAVINWLGEWTRPDFSETFKCRDVKPLKRVGSLDRCRNQAQVQSGVMTAQPKKYKSRTQQKGLFCLFCWCPPARDFFF